MSCSFCNNNHLVSHLYHFYTSSALFGHYKSRFHRQNSSVKGIRRKSVLFFILKCITMRQKNLLYQFRYFHRSSSVPQVHEILWKTWAATYWLLGYRNIYSLHWAHYFIRHDEMGSNGWILVILFRDSHWAWNPCDVQFLCICNIYIQYCIFEIKISKLLLILYYKWLVLYLDRHRLCT